VAAELIGRCRCPVCGGDKARLSLAKSLLVVLTCNGCNLQIFARSDRSDEKLRALLVADPAPAPAPADPVRETPPAPVRTESPPIQPPAPAVRPAAPTRPSWGFMR
jgi:hypothetical protein